MTRQEAGAAVEPRGNYRIQESTTKEGFAGIARAGVVLPPPGTLDFIHSLFEGPGH